MYIFPGLTGNRPAFLAQVAAWLADSRLAPPAGLRLRIRVTDAVPEWPDPRTCYPQAGVEIRAGDPLGWAHIRWRTAPAAARIAADRPAAEVWLSEAAAREPERVLRSFLLVVMIFLWRRDGRYHVHSGAAVSPSGRGWLLAGNSGSRQVHHDRAACRARLGDRHRRHRVPDGRCRRPGGGPGVPLTHRAPAREPAAAGRRGGREETRRDHAFAPGQAGLSGRGPGRVSRLAVEPDVVLFTELAESGEDTRLTPLAGDQAMHGLLRWSPWAMFEATAAQNHLDLLARLAGQARCFRARLAPDLLRAPGGLEDSLA